MPDDERTHEPYAHWLKDYIDVLAKEKQRQLDGRLSELHRQLDERFRTQRETLLADTQAIRERFAGTNEWRATVVDQQQTFATKEAVALIEQRLNERTDANGRRVAELENMRANLEGRIWAVGAVMVLLEVVLKVLWK